jgi:hypothetical protein
VEILAMSRRLDAQKFREWEGRFERYRAGGETVGRFCANEGVSVNMFYYWARRVGSRLAKPRTDPAGVARERMPRRAATSELAIPENSMVRFRLNAAVEVSVPAHCLEVIRCLAHCVQDSSAKSGDAFQEVMVSTR